MFTRGLFQTCLARQGQILDKISALVDAVTIHTTLADVYPWTVDGLRAAHRRIEDRNGLGKAVLAVL
jgi:NADPH:quinone reductase-like Zn-dependent oxidoreductase